MRAWADATIFDLLWQFHLSYLPPLMVYLAAGVSGLTAIVGTFFIKDYLGLSASYLAGLAFWAGLPWTLKMPLGHLVDLWWRHKAWLVYLGASLVAVSLLIMVGLIGFTESMLAVLPAESWFVISTLLAPTGYVIQDVVADAMTVEAVPLLDDQGEPYAESVIKNKHTTMQTFGRLAIIGGSALVAAVNIMVFSGVGDMSEQQQRDIYVKIYLLALVIPLISVAGVWLGEYFTRARRRRLGSASVPAAGADAPIPGKPADQVMQPNWWILGGSLAFVVFSVTMGLVDVPGSQEIVFIGAISIVIFLMARLFAELGENARRELIGTAVIIFMFRAVPGPGPGQTWFEIDVLGFDQQFLSVLSLITTVIAMLGMVVLRPLMAKRSIAYVVVLLSVVAGVLSLPNIGLFYGIQNWTQAWSGGLIDARMIALIDTMLESPLGQIAMIPMLAWIARSAPAHLKATFFAVMASFTNLALSASSLFTKYLNQTWLVTREVRALGSEGVSVPADYSELGVLLIAAALIGVGVPLLTIVIVQRSRWRTTS